MIAKDQNIALLTVAKAASEKPEWKAYADYCFSREKGIRKLAFQKLNDFLKSTQQWRIEQKIEFVKFLLPFFETVREADYGPFPQPLSDQLIKPTLEEWCANEKTDNRPFRWYGRYYRSEVHLFQAIELDPQDDLARETLLSWWTSNVFTSLHHLPEGYIGDPKEDLKLADKIKKQIAKLSNEAHKVYWANVLEGDLEIIKSYLEWQNSGHPNLAQWGKENNRTVGHDGISTYYYDK